MDMRVDAIGKFQQYDFYRNENQKRESKRKMKNGNGFQNMEFGAIFKNEISKLKMEN